MLLPRQHRVQQAEHQRVRGGRSGAGRGRLQRWGGCLAPRSASTLLASCTTPISRAGLRRGLVWDSSGDWEAWEAWPATGSLDAARGGTAARLEPVRVSESSERRPAILVSNDRPNGVTAHLHVEGGHGLPMPPLARP
jgi:hypothetical protein